MTESPPPRRDPAGKRPRLLWVTDEPPGLGLGGGNIRQAHLLSGLGRAFDVCLLVMGEVGDEVRQSVHEVIEVPPRRLPQPKDKTLRRGMDLWLALGASGPWEVALTSGRRRRLGRLVDQLALEADVVVVSHLGLAPLLPGRRTAPWVLQLHHVSSAKAAQERALLSGRRQQWLAAREMAKARRFERWAVAAFDVVITVSDDDASALAGDGAEVPADRLVVVRNGVDTTLYPSTPLPDAPSVVMTGSLHYGPNIDGALWFVEEVFPLVRRQVPDAALDLVGRAPPPEVIALADHPGVAVHADVPSVGPWLERGRVAVVPLRLGTGTRLKALEAMAAGRPVVGTTLGLGGLDILDGVHARVMDDPVLMAEAVVRLLVDQQEASRLAGAGRALVEERYEWSEIADEMVECLASLLSRTTGRFRSTAG